MVDWGVAHAWLHTVGPKSVARTMGAANRATVLQSVPISCHFHGCTALLILRFVVVKWRYIKYKALLFLPFYYCCAAAAATTTTTTTTILLSVYQILFNV